MPTDIAGCIDWLDASQIVGLSNGDPVPTWTDESGNGNDAVQATGAKQPSYQTNQLNGHPIVRFDSARCMGITTLSVNQPYTIFIVLKDVMDGSTPSENEIFSGTSNGFFVIYYNATQIPAVFPWTGASSSVPMTTDVLCIIMNGASSAIFQDGVSTSTGNSGTTGLGADFVIGAFFNQTQNFMNADVAEIIIYDSALGTTDRQTVETYLATKYAL